MSFALQATLFDDTADALIMRILSNRYDARPWAVLADYAESQGWEYLAKVWKSQYQYTLSKGSPISPPHSTSQRYDIPMWPGFFLTQISVYSLHATSLRGFLCSRGWTSERYWLDNRGWAVSGEYDRIDPRTMLTWPILRYAAVRLKESRTYRKRIWPSDELALKLIQEHKEQS